MHRKIQKRLLEVIWPAFLLRPLVAMRFSMRLELDLVGADDFAAAILALKCMFVRNILYFERKCFALTMEVGFGALTGRPFAFTGARVPALSAFLCSRWICRKCE